VYLGFTGLRQAFRKYDNLFGAVVSSPIPNLAPRRLLDSMGWRKVGWIDQDYPEHGRVRYDIYYLNRSEFEKRLQDPAVRRLVERLGGDP
jgi:hypothetical protein